MKKLFSALLLTFGLWPNVSRACDICGCFMGITPYDNQSSVSLMHRYRVFNGYQLLGQDHQFFPPGPTRFCPPIPTRTPATSTATSATRPTSRSTA